MRRWPRAIVYPLALLAAVGIGYVAVRYATWAMQARTAGWLSLLGIAVAVLAGIGFVSSPRRPR